MLVEIAARISGGVDPLFNQTCLGNDQIELTLESYLTPQKFLQRIGQRYQIKKNGLQVFLSSKKAGTITAMDLPKQLSQIPSVINFNLKPKIGDIVVKTFDLSSSLDMVHLAAENKYSLLEDYQHIQQLLDKYVEIC